jgi:integrase
VGQGESPARAKADDKRVQRETGDFAHFAAIWLRDAGLAESTRAMRKGILDRDVLPVFGKLRLEEVTPERLMTLCDKLKARGAPATALHARDIVQQVFKHVNARGLKMDNPANAVSPSAIGSFKPRDRALSPEEIKTFFTALQGVGTLPTLKLALKFILLTMLRKGELIGAKWSMVNFEDATLTIPAELMKAGRAHVVYLSQQALDILVAMKTCAGTSAYLLPGRYDTDGPIAHSTLNRVIEVTLARLKKEGREMASFSVHDLRRTASTHLHEAGYNSDWIEKCLAHEQRGTRAVYNKAEYGPQRREMLQAWANMVDSWVGGAA